MPDLTYAKRKVEEALQAARDLTTKLEEADEALKRITPEDPNMAEKQLIEGLSPREYEVFIQIVTGKNYKEIADQLGISPRTVKVYRSHIMKKLKTYDVASLTRMAIRHGLVTAL